jgi:magnesium transporter
VSIVIRVSGAPAPVALSELPALLAAKKTVWVDLDGSGPEISQLLSETFKFHPLLVEDILEQQDNAKVEDYGTHIYLAVLAIASEPRDCTKLHSDDLDLVLGDSWLVTHHIGPSRTVEEVVHGLEKNPRPFEHGPSAIAHTLLDRLVDDYMPVIDAFDDELESLERAVIDDPSRGLLARLFEVKRSLQLLRRTSIHQREVLQRLARGEFDEIPQSALPFFRDVLDHFVRVADLADSYRELLSNDLDAYLSVLSNRMNEVMKTLTIVTTLLLPATFVVGLYGMNFEHIPELHWRYGYLYCWVVLIALFLSMLGWFKYRKWI